MTHSTLKRRMFLANSALASAALAFPGSAFGEEKPSGRLPGQRLLPQLGKHSVLIKVIRFRL